MQWCSQVFHLYDGRFNMALFIGKNKSTAALISRSSSPKLIIEELGDKYISPIIGELNYAICKMNDDTLVKQSSGIYVPTKDFNGWTCPDGKTLNASNFPDAFKEYGIVGNETFQIPNIVDPIRSIGSNINETKKGQAIVDKCNDVPRHHHMATNDDYGKFEMCEMQLPKGLSFWASESCALDKKNLTKDADFDGITAVLPRFHYGSYNATTSIPVPLDLHLKFEDLGKVFGSDELYTDDPVSVEDPTEPVGEDDPDIQLEHLTIPLMIYIGKPVL